MHWWQWLLAYGGVATVACYLFERFGNPEEKDAPPGMIVGIFWPVSLIFFGGMAWWAAIAWLAKVNRLRAASRKEARQLKRAMRSAEASMRKFEEES